MAAAPGEASRPHTVGVGVVLAQTASAPIARARAKADDEDIRLWFEVTFTPEGEPWTDAYDRVLALLDIA